MPAGVLAESLAVQLGGIAEVCREGSMVVALFLDEGFSVAGTARRVGVGPGTLGNWFHPGRTDRGEWAGLTSSDKAEPAGLRCENAGLGMERDLLKAATSVWVTESGQ